MVLILCSSVVYTTRRFVFGLALLFVYVFLLSFSILVGEEGAGLCAYRAFDLYHFFSSSWCQGWLRLLLVALLGLFCLLFLKV